jgi:hypothetical protein
MALIGVILETNSAGKSSTKKQVKIVKQFNISNAPGVKYIGTSCTK